MATFICNLIFAGFIKFEGYQVPAIIMSGILGLALLYYLVSSSRWLMFITRVQKDQHVKDEVGSPCLLRTCWTPACAGHTCLDGYLDAALSSSL